MKIITLCGSSKFKNTFENINKKLTMQGNVVLSLGVYSGFDKLLLTKKQTKLLINVHFKKIKMSDTIYVINVGGYIGKNTKSEIDYAKSLNKKIVYLEE